MKKIDIIAVSFLNTLPFIYGIKNSGFLENFKLQLEVPSICADHAIKNIPDIALVPIGSFTHLKDYLLLNDYCLGTTNIVRSVLLLSNQPIEKIKTIYLDSDSRTSNKLIKILILKYWKIKVEYKQNEEFDNNHLSAKISIGDKAFNEYKKFQYSYDLAEYWHKLTGLPFVFAVWVYKTDTKNNIIANFSESLSFGIENIDNLIKELKLNEKYPDIDVYTYLHKNMNYIFDKEKHKAFNHYLSLLNDNTI